MRRFLCLSAVVFSGYVCAVDLPTLPSQQLSSPHSVFLSSEQDQADINSWKVNGGYSYSVFDKLDVYVGARFNNNTKANETGVLSGVSYQITPRVSLASTLHSYNSEAVADKKDTALSAEVSSRVRLTENLDLHATLDYQEWQKEVEFGLGFRF